MNLIAFDQSTTCTGWCVMEQETGNIVDYGAIVPIGNTNERIRKTIKKCIKLCERYQVAFVFIEGIQVQKNPVVYEVLAKLQGTLEICLEEKGYIVNTVKASEWRRKIGIKNRKRTDVKIEAMEKVASLYDVVANEDECEAILFARAFCEVIR